MTPLASQIVLALLLLVGVATFLIAEIRRTRRRDVLSDVALDRLREQAYDLRDREGEAFDV